MRIAICLLAAALAVGCGKDKDKPADQPAAAPAAPASPKEHCKLKGSCKPCSGAPDCPGETCTKYQLGSAHYSACVDDRGCSIGDVMMQTSDLCGTKNPVP
jgi:hypothetical protein